MKKISIILSVSLMIMLFTSCGAVSPTKVTENFLDAVKNQDAKTISECYAEKDFALSTDSLIMGDDDETEVDEDETNDEVYKEFQEDFTNKLLDFDYEVTDEKIDGDEATVNVKITTYEFGKELTTFFNTYISQGMMLAFDDDSDEKLEALEKTLFQTMIDNLKEKTYVGEATLKLKKTDDGWKIEKIADDSDFMNALTGNAVVTMNNLDDIWG